MAYPYRETCRRQHRIVGNYLAMQAWLSKLDCFVLMRTDLENFIKLKKFKSTRIKWLQTDLTPWFPYQKVFRKNSALSSIQFLFLSRVPMDKFIPLGKMSVDERIKGMIHNSLPTNFFKFAVKKPLYDEGGIISKLSLFANGVDAPLVDENAGMTHQQQVS
jgi:hypothetical protein